MVRNKIIIIVLIMIFSSISYAHSGGTDSSGGHWNHRTGRYHNHHKQNSIVVFATIVVTFGIMGFICIIIHDEEIQRLLYIFIKNPLVKIIKDFLFLVDYVWHRKNFIFWAIIVTVWSCFWILKILDLERK